MKRIFGKLLTALIILSIAAILSSLAPSHALDTGKTIKGVVLKNLTWYDIITWKKVPNANPERAYVMGFAYNDNYLLMMQKVKDPRMISQGKKYIIYVIGLSGRKVSSINRYYIPLFNVQQYIDLNNGWILLIGNNQTQLGKFNILTGKYEKLYAIEANKPGFKMTGFYTTDERGNIYVEGFFFDEQQRAESGDNYFVKLDLSKRGLKIFSKKVLNTTEVFRKVQPIRMFYWGNIDFCVITRFTGYYPKEIYVYSKRYGGLRKVDTKDFIVEIAASRNYRYLYLAKHRGNYYMYIRDLKTGKKWDIKSPNQLPLVYPFISNNGKLAVVAFLDFSKQAMDFWFALEKDNFKLRKFLDDVPAGSFKLSSSGKKFSLQNKEGILIGEFKI